MTVSDCPLGCEEGGPFSTKNGAVMHMINKEDDLHAEVSSKADAYALLDDAENQEAAEDSEGADESTPEPSPEDTPEGTTDPTPEGTGSVDFPTAPEGPADRDPTEPVEPIQTDTPDDDLGDGADLDDGGDDDPDPPAGAAAAGEGSAAAGLAVGAVAVAGLAFMKLRGRQRGSQTDDGPNYEVV
jgi:hypothetical protein